METARREIAEETGNRSEPEELGLRQSFLIESHYLESRLSAPVIASEIGFVTEMSSGAEIRMDADEHDAYGWFPFPQAYDKIRWTDDREALEKLEMMLPVDGSRLPGDGRQPETPNRKLES